MIMTLLRILVAAALLSLETGTTAFARTSNEHLRQEYKNCKIEGYAQISPSARCIDGHLWLLAPPVTVAAPPEQPGGNCDFGDNPMIC
jgi:hypothetical protein